MDRLCHGLAVGPKHAIPMHYGTSPFLVGTPQEYIKAMGKTSTKIHDMKPGETIEF
jgi:L-ascorbate metabolism protein UlaG (beta-lactamase superfamily)